MGAEENFEEDVQSVAMQLSKKHHLERTFYICCPMSEKWSFRPSSINSVKQLLNNWQIQVKTHRFQTINTLSQWRQLLENAPDPDN